MLSTSPCIAMLLWERFKLLFDLFLCVNWCRGWRCGLVGRVHANYACSCIWTLYAWSPGLDPLSCNWAQWCISVNPASRRQDDQMFKFILDYAWHSRPAWAAWYLCQKKSDRGEIGPNIDSVSTDRTEDSCGPKASYCIDIGLDQ